MVDCCGQLLRVSDQHQFLRLQVDRNQGGYFGALGRLVNYKKIQSPAKTVHYLPPCAVKSAEDDLGLLEKILFDFLGVARAKELLNEKLVL